MYTINDLIEKTELPYYKIEYIIRRDRVKPCKRIGSACLYDDRAARRILRALGKEGN